tara:strand:+ start:227 stop:367 length:141 start_codon:yes stop_codon:yes gene_type:complete
MGLNEQTREFNGKPPISQAGGAFFRAARFPMRSGLPLRGCALADFD